MSENNPLKIGVHLSISGSLLSVIDRAYERRCTTFQMFTRNPRGWKVSPLNSDEAKMFREKLESSGLTPIVAHMPYLPNIASSGEFYSKSVESLTTELRRCEELGIAYLATHLGSHQGQGYSVGLSQILRAIDHAHKEVLDGTMILLENTAGSVHSMGSSFEELKRILEGLDDPDRVGVCFDTCHAYAAGYDLGTATSVNAVLRRFDEVLGLDTMKVVHLNDSKTGLRSRVDRHARIGRGFIGDQGFRALLRHPAIRTAPLILETPMDDESEEVAEMMHVRELAGEPPSKWVSNVS